MGMHEDTSVHENAVTRRKLLSRRFYVLQALFILLAMSISLASLVWYARFGGSPLWLAAADLLLLAACYQALASLLETVAPLIAALDIFGIVLLAALLLAAPLLSPIALIWAIRRAVQAGAT